jgi:phospholipid/cholesterol/gamma-HCH transport system substrate-binding protein
MEKTRLEIKVGLFVFVCLVLLAAMMVQFNKGGSLLNDSITLRLHASNVGGLKRDAAVLLSGVPVGSVKDIKIADDGKSVTVFLKIYKKPPIYHDARFVIEQAGFLGDQYVSVIPTTNQPPTFADNADVNCQEPFDLQEVARSAAGFIKRIDETAKKLDASVTDLRAQVLNAQTLASFGTSITNMKMFTEQALDTVKDINTIVNTNGAQVSLAVSNAVAFSSGLIQLQAAAQALLATNSVNINQATKDIAEATATFKKIADDVQAGKGLAGTILQNPDLATNVQAIAANLSVTSSNLNRLGLWGILWSHPPPATNTMNNNATLASPRHRP